MSEKIDQDYILCECAGDVLEQFVSSLESGYEIVITRMPLVCMTLLKAEDSVDNQPFYLGEALTTECEVSVDQITGYGICLGDEPVRSYCIAFIDAITQGKGRDVSNVEQFLTEQLARVKQRELIEFNHILRTKVDFKLMEQD